MLTLETINETKSRINKSVFTEITGKFNKAMNKVIEGKIDNRNGLIDLVFVNDEAIQDINKEYRKKDKPTDVISFAYLEVTDYKNQQTEVIVGDIFISIDTAKRQAKEKKHSLIKELEILFIHGVLHLLGFDHKNDEDEAEMEGWARKILKA